MTNLVTDFGQKLFSWVLDAWSQQTLLNSPLYKASCGPWACVPDGMDGFLTSALNHPTDGRDTQQCALYLWFWHVCFGGYWECCNFPVQTLTFCFWVTEKTPPLITNYCFPQICAIFVQFPLKDQNKCEAFAFSSCHSNSWYRLFLKSYLAFKSSFRTRELLYKVNSSPSTCPIGRITALSSFMTVSLTVYLDGHWCHLYPV